MQISRSGTIAGLNQLRRLHGYERSSISGFLSELCGVDRKLFLLKKGEARTLCGARAVPVRYSSISSGATSSNCVRVTQFGHGFGTLGRLRQLCDEGQLQQALQSVDLMEQQGMHISINIFYHLLQGCINKNDLAAGKKVHGLIIKYGFESNTFLGSHLIRMFALCKSLLDANEVFSRLPEPNVFAWNAIISAQNKFGEGEQAIKFYLQMQHSSVKLSGHIFVAALKACSSIESLDQGKLIHVHIIENGCESDAYIGSTLIDMYAKCWDLQNAGRVFERLRKRDLVIWSAMIAGFAHHGCGQETLLLFQQMQKNGMEPDNITFVSILKACTSIAALDKGKVIHCRLVENGELDVYVGSSLIDMYSECGDLHDARKVFDKLPKQDVVTWSAMIAGYALHEADQEALFLLQQMQQNGIEPNNITYVSLLKACCNIAALDQGRMLHSYVLFTDFELDVHFGSTLIDMYGKCGSLQDAQVVFDKLGKQSVVSWNAIIAGYALHGDYVLALCYFEKMKSEGMKPNDITFVCLLSVCCHLGLLHNGCHLFTSITKDHGSIPIIDHYNCMVNLFGRSGCFNEAEDLLKTMPFQSNCVGWSSLLSHCKSHGNVNVGRHCFNEVVTMNEKYSSGYVIMAKIYADAGMWEAVSRVQDRRERALAWKKPGIAFIEVGKKGA